MSSILTPLLASILLSVLVNLPIGKEVNQILIHLFSPILSPINNLNYFTNKKISYFANLPNVARENREQKVLIAHLLWQNESLKSHLRDKNTEGLLKNNYQKTLPVEISGSPGRYLATSTQSTNEVQVGMPLVSGNILLGLVSEKINDNTLRIVTLDDHQAASINLHSASGQKGVYKYIENKSQIVNVPSLTPLILGDFVLTESADLIPKDLLVGKIIEILTNPQDPLQKGKISLYDTLENNPEHLAIIVKP